jgi:hypothetical protein
VEARQVASGPYAAATATRSFTVAAEVPPLTITPIPNQVVGVQSISVGATSPSWGAITYSILSGPATIAYSHDIVVSGPGTVVVQASQAAQGDYTAGTATTSFSVAPKAP